MQKLTWHHLIARIANIFLAWGLYEWGSDKVVPETICHVFWPAFFETDYCCNLPESFLCKNWKRVLGSQSSFILGNQKFREKKTFQTILRLGHIFYDLFPKVTSSGSGSQPWRSTLRHQLQPTWTSCPSSPTTSSTTTSTTWQTPFTACSRSRRTTRTRTERFGRKMRTFWASRPTEVTKIETSGLGVTEEARMRRTSRQCTPGNRGYTTFDDYARTLLGKFAFLVINYRRWHSTQQAVPWAQTFALPRFLKVHRVARGKDSLLVYIIFIFLP